MQWYDSGIPFSTVAYYCVFRQSIDAKLGLQLGAPKASVERFDENWSRSIAALHFGVAPEIAYQVLLESPLRKALVEGDSDRIGRLMDQPGFTGVFRRVIDQYGDATTPALVVSTINCLSMAESATSNFAEEWAILADALVSTPVWASFADTDRRAVGALLDRIDEPSKRKVFASTLSHILNSQAAAQPEIADGIGNLLVDVYDRHSELLSPDLTVALPVNPETFVRVAAICVTRPILVSKLRQPANAGDVSAVLINDLLAGENLDTESRLRAVLGTPLDVLTESYLTTALQVVSRSNQATASTALLALGLANRRGLPFAVSQVSGLAGNGRLGALITEGWVSLDWNVFARAVALLLLKAPNGFPALQPTLEAKTIVFPQIGRQLDIALQEFANDTETSFEVLADIVTASPPSRPYVVAILSDRLNEASSVAPSTQALVDRFAQMQSLFSPAQLTALVSRYADDDALWTILDTLPLAGTALSMLKELGAGMPSARKKAAEALGSAMQKATEADWTATLAAPGDLLNGLELWGTWRDSGIQIPALFAPLLSAQEQVIAAENAMWLTRYFYLVSFLPTASSQTVLRSLRDRILATSSIPMLVTLLNEGGSSLIRDGHFDEKADEIVRRLIAEFLEKPEILAYLHSYVDALSSTVAVSHPESRQELARKLEEVGAAGTEEPNRWASELIVRWDLGGQSTTNA
jgi:hypothetical protein